MKIFLGTDHAGFKLKEKLKAYLIELGYEIQDMGNFIYDKQDDYPDFIPLVAGKVAEDPEHSRGIVLGGSGQGEAMVANRIKGVRAAVVYNYNEDIVKLSREHNDANILSLGARFLSEEEAKKIVKLWLETPFSNEERHKRRICKLSQL
ncbi:RpiB/LacA/LacB family sugar-phosphate isomerase [Patescibacteria group bacterium]|nr:RpiB/LacA/LacB family sugar-phosphate isomerase [Patescibacteria group bacterium]